jgi:hypothetical protein
MQSAELIPNFRTPAIDTCHIFALIRKVRLRDRGVDRTLRNSHSTRIVLGSSFQGSYDFLSGRFEKVMCVVLGSVVYEVPQLSCNSDRVP